MTERKKRWQSRKQAAADFTPKNLPHNRRQVFFDVLSIHWKTFFLFGLLFLLLCLPMNVVSVLKTLFLNNLYAEAGNLGDEEKRQLVSTIMSLNITAAVLQIPCILFWPRESLVL